MSEITISLRGLNCYIVRNNSNTVLGSITRDSRTKLWSFESGTNKPNADQLTQIVKQENKLNGE